MELTARAVRLVGAPEGAEIKKQVQSVLCEHALATNLNEDIM